MVTSPHSSPCRAMAPKRKEVAGGAAAAKQAKPEEQQPAAQAAGCVEIEHCKS